MQRAPLSIGDRFVNLSGGGAGYGEPLDRAPQDVLDDVIDGYVSEEKRLGYLRSPDQGGKHPRAVPRAGCPLRSIRSQDSSTTR